MTNHQPLIKDLRPIIDEANHSVSIAGYTEDDIREILAALREALKGTSQVASEHRPEQIESESVSDKAQEVLHDAEKFLQDIAGIALPKNRIELYVKATTVQQLQEYHRDESLLLLLASLSAGAALGVLVNWAAADTIILGKAGWIALILFGITTLVFAGLWWRAQRKTKEIKKRIEADK